MIKHKHLNSNGATLIEVMISVGIFIMVLGSLLNVAVQSMRMGKRSEYVYTAFNLARNHIERLKAYDFASLSSASETSTAIDADGAPDESGLFTRSTTVSASGNIATVTVSVSYTMSGVQSAAPMQMSCIIYNE